MKKIIILISIFLLSFTITINTFAKEEYISNSTAGILIEKTTGQILYEKNIHKRASPASMTKIMTLLLTYEALEANNLTKDTILTTSEYAASMGGSQVFLKEGELISVDECLKCICISSANDCSVLIAEAIAGSEDQFVNMMNDKVKSLGLENTNFRDCTGLEEKNHYTTAYDLSIIARELVSKFPDVYNYTTMKEDYIRKESDNPFWLVNTNKMIGKIEGLKGLKTGYTSFSGYCITLSMEKDNLNLISVVFGYDNALKRNSESLELLRYGFNNYKMDTILNKDTLLESFEHILYKNSIKIIIEEDINYLCKKSEKNSYEYKYNYNLEKDKLSLFIYLNNQEIITKEYKLNISNDKRNIFEVFLEILRKIY